MQTNTAEVVTREHVTEAHGATMPSQELVIVTSNPRESAVAKARELAARLESGELNGFGFQWNDSEDQPAMVVVECALIVPGVRREGSVTIKRYTFAAPAAL